MNKLIYKVPVIGYVVARYRELSMVKSAIKSGDTDQLANQLLSGEFGKFSLCPIPNYLGWVYSSRGGVVRINSGPYGYYVRLRPVGKDVDSKPEEYGWNGDQGKVIYHASLAAYKNISIEDQLLGHRRFVRGLFGLSE